METSQNRLHTIRIANQLTIKDWEDLKPNLNYNKKENWGNAFNFFEQRITTRYLKPIHEILGMNLNTGEGFAVVNLQCSLIETIESFYNGWLYKFPFFYQKDGITKLSMSNKKVFESFFSIREPFKSLDIPSSFYSDVRCGLLHETQTKNKWIIRDRHNDKFYEKEEDGNKIIIYRTNFQTALEKVIDDYKQTIIEGGKESKDYRENFIAKFDHICSESKAK